MTVRSTFGAVVLCGGRSTRMGSDKAQLPIGDETFLHRICRIVGDVVAETVVVASADQSLPKLPNAVSIVRDIVPDQGPLAGLLTGLRQMRESFPAVECVWVGSCDAPFIRVDMIERLLNFLPGHDAVVVASGDGIHPLGAVYQMSCEATVRRLFDAGERRLLELCRQLDTHIVPAEQLSDLDPTLLFLQNINSPEDYERFTNN